MRMRLRPLLHACMSLCSCQPDHTTAQPFTLVCACAHQHICTHPSGYM